MDQNRRAFLESAGTFIVLDGRRLHRLGARRRRRARARSELRRHRSLVGHGHRHREVHRVRQLRARMQGGERRPLDEAGCFRTWVERYQVPMYPLEPNTRAWTRRMAATTDSPASINPVKA